jgi:uncharacterized membrane protein YhaH (DUF805 family)
MDRLLENLFAFKGRINRITWFVFFLTLAAMESVAGTLLEGMLGATAPVAGSNPLEAYFSGRAEFAAALIFLWPSLAIDVKRWHDIGRSGWLTLIAYGPAFALFLAEQLKQAGAISGTPLPEPLLATMALVFLVYLILLGGRKGSAAANRFGERSGPGLSWK